VVRTGHAPKQGHNHNLDNIALNYPCPISRLRVVGDNRTKSRENETHKQNYFLSTMSMQATTPLLDPRWGPDPPPTMGAWGPTVNVSKR
jgi:hypothetical protein